MTGLRARWQREKGAVATWIVLVPLLASLVFLGVLAYELLSFQTTSLDAGRCTLLSAASVSLPKKLVQYLMYLLAFGAAVIAKDFKRIRSREVILYGALAGVAGGLALILYVNADTELGYFTHLTCFDSGTDSNDGTVIGEMYKKIHGSLVQTLAALTVWHLSLVIAQLGLNLPSAEAGAEAK